MDTEKVTPFVSTAVVGGGYMGGGMAQCFVLADFDCTLADVNIAMARAAKERLVSEARTYEADGLFAPGSADVINERLRIAASVEDAVEGVDYITEVVSEDLAVKDAVLSRICASASRHAVISSNTSAIPINILAESVTHPGRFLGAHWMNPAPFVPCVEIIPSQETTEETMRRVETFLDALGKMTSRVADIAGFIASRLQFALFHESLRMVDEGSATAELIDEVVSNSFGFRLPFFGPFAGADMAGLDVYVGVYESLRKAYGDRFTAPSSLLERVAEGKLGLKTGAGFTSVAASDRDAIARYRNRAYSALTKMREELGDRPVGQSGQ